MSFENFSVLDYSADPSGKADSYRAFKDWSIAISKARSGMGFVPSGTYRWPLRGLGDGQELVRRISAASARSAMRSILGNNALSTVEQHPQAVRSIKATSSSTTT